MGGRDESNDIKSAFLSDKNLKILRSLKSFYWTQIGPLMQACGCGCHAPVSSNSFSIVTAQ